MGLADDLMQKNEELKNQRSSFETHWQEVAEFIFPRADEFYGGNKSPGEKRTRKRFDDTAVLALNHGAAAIESIVSPRGQKWHGIGVPDSLSGDHEALIWADRVRDFLFAKRYSALTNFASQMHEVYLSLLAFGTGVMVLEDMLDGTIRYKSGHVAEHCFMENAKGRIDTVYRDYKMTARQAVERFGSKACEKIQKAMEKNPSEKFEFLHVVQPDVDNETEGEFASYHVCKTSNQIMGIGFYRTFPYIISRWTTSPNEIYGRSPAMDSLAEVKMLNQIRKTDLRARHMAVDPPILAADQSRVRKFNNRPGAINYGTIDEATGAPLMRPYMSGTNISTSNDTMNQSREFINRSFFLNLFQILVDTPQMTATEVLERANEKGQLLTPTAGRQMHELLQPMIMREIDIYESYGVFEDDGPLAMPQGVKDMGGEYEVIYTNPLSRMQKSEEALGTERTLQSLLPLMQIDPSLADMLDLQEYANIMRESNGAPARLFKSPEDMQAVQQQKQQQAQMQQMIDAAPQVAGAIKDVAQAQSYTGE
jgi:hypothetical protein